MPDAPTTLSGTNEEGFISLSRLRRVAREGSLASFVKTYPVPAVLVVDVGVGAAEGNPAATTQAGPQLVTLFKSGKSAFRYLDEVAFLLKRPGNPFPQFISVGRTPNNDVVIGVETVSKLHGYFTQKEGRWFVTDFRSTNGTLLNGEPLVSGQPQPVATGDQVRWGDQIVTEFLTPQALFERARNR
jgi:hypothetical protein